MLSCVTLMSDNFMRKNESNMTSNMVPDEDTLTAAAWVCYVHSLDGRTCLKVTDTPKWSSDFHREKYVHRAREIFAAIAVQKELANAAEKADTAGHLITSADVNNAGAAKANALWGGNQNA